MLILVIILYQDLEEEVPTDMLGCSSAQANYNFLDYQPSEMISLRAAKSCKLAFPFIISMRALS
ncbi:hypothetical protein EJB05_01837, partial [Eragrostis curvula]